MTTAEALADETMDALFDVFPIDATLYGIAGWDDRLPDHSATAEQAIATRLGGIADRARQLDPAGLSPSDELTRAVTIHEADSWRAQLAIGAVEYSVADSFTSPVVGMLSLLPLIVIGEQAHADGYLARLGAMPAALETIASRHRIGVAAGRLPVRHLVEALITRLDGGLADAEGDPLRLPAPGADRGIDVAAFVAERDRLVADVVRPALAGYRQSLQDDVLPHGRSSEQPGLCWLPDGEATYATLIRVHTTTPSSAEELHQIGLDVIAELADEYVEIGSEAFGTRDLDEIRSRLRNDPALCWNDGEELLAAARTAIARAEAAMPSWFGRMPSKPCVVEAVPAHDAAGAAAAYYMPPAVDGSRPGTYYANTLRAEERDRYSSESISFHEAVPGHHLQLSLAQELTDLPLLRRLTSVTAYAEGWGLYAERLADEMGLYSDAVARLGMLAADSIRAARLVVDTGLHVKGWTRQQVIDYLVANTVMPQVEIESETDRYIADPGQALAYMVGRREIMRMRADARQRLGEHFDIRAFHDTVLEHGSLPLGILDDVVRRWIADVAAG